MTKWNKKDMESRGTDLHWRRSSGMVLFFVTVLLLAMAVGLHLRTASADTTVWWTQMTVGVNDQDSFEQLGFLDIPDELDGGFWNDTGSLDDPTFTHAGVDYTVSAIYYPDFSGANQYLFLHLDHPLPDGFIFQAGGVQHEIADATALGWSHSHYMWELDSSPGWAEGDALQVSLITPGLEEDPAN